MRGSREISLVPSLHRASTDALIIYDLYIHCIYNIVIRVSHKSEYTIHAQ